MTSTKALQCVIIHGTLCEREYKINIINNYIMATIIIGTAMVRNNSEK